MRVVALSDVHGNVPALEAVLAEVEAEAPDVIVVCGDVAVGPLPVETIELLEGLPRTRFVQGNADRELVTGFDTGPDGPAGERPFQWGAGLLEQRHRDFLASFADTQTLDVDGLGRVLFCHGTPWSDEDMITARTPDDRLRGFLEGVEADVVVCGHTHMQFDRVLDGVRVVNCGSVGMPFGRTGAFWAVLGPDVRLRRTEYDREAAAARIRRESRLEIAGAFADGNVLTVPGEEDAFAYFATAGGP